MLLPELVAKYYTENKPNEASVEIDSCCTCNLSSKEDELIHCGQKDCSIKTFHLKCVRVKKIPKGKWFCLECKKLRNLKKLEKKKQKEKVNY